MSPEAGENCGISFGTILWRIQPWLNAHTDMQ